MALSAGTDLGPYRIRRFLGRGPDVTHGFLPATMPKNPQGSLEFDHRRWGCGGQASLAVKTGGAGDTGFWDGIYVLR